MSETRLNPFYTVILFLLVAILAFVGVRAGTPLTPKMPGARSQSLPQIPERALRGSVTPSLATDVSAPAAAHGAPPTSSAPTAPVAPAVEAPAAPAAESGDAWQ